MSMENGFIPTSKIERGIEKFPTKAELDAKFIELLAGKEFIERREGKIEFNDKEEITRYDITFILEGGAEREFNFQRAEYNYSEEGLDKMGANEKQRKNLRFSASISKGDDEESYPRTVANYLDGLWSIPR